MNEIDFCAGDCLNIRQHVINFGDTISKNNTSTVYALTAAFGYGKTFFCECLKKYLLSKSIDCIYLNAWKTDFLEHPLIPLISELSEQIHTDSILMQKIQEIGIILCNILSSINYCGISIGFSKLKKPFKDYNTFNEYKNYKEQLQNFKNILQEIATEKKLIIIIDELDRCRPDYAVKLLEVIKHIFDVPHVHFVLSYDEAQLTSTVKQLFGGIDFDGYIRKFVDFSFNLPEPDFLSYAKFLYEKHRTGSFLQDNSQKVFMLKTAFEEYPYENLINSQEFLLPNGKNARNFQL